ncbi:hypothetical protein ACWS7L_12275 [Exiguobacterium artemiae]
MNRHLVFFVFTGYGVVFVTPAFLGRNASRGRRRRPGLACS